MYKTFFGFTRALIGLSLLVAVVWQVTDRIAADLFRPSEYFAYFSIVASILTGLLLLVTATRVFKTGRLGKKQEIAELVAVVSMIVVGAVYHALLGDLAVDPRDVGYDWPVIPNEIIHTYVPIALPIIYLLSIKSYKVKLRASLWALVFPLAWLSFSIIRGLSDGWWPYWFINPGGEGGITGVVIYVSAIAGFFAGLSVLVLAIKLGLKKLIKT